VDRDVAQPG